MKIELIFQILRSKFSIFKDKPTFDYLKNLISELEKIQMILRIEEEKIRALEKQLQVAKEELKKKIFDLSIQCEENGGHFFEPNLTFGSEKKCLVCQYEE